MAATRQRGESMARWSTRRAPARRRGISLGHGIELVAGATDTRAKRAFMRNLLHTAGSVSEKRVVGHV
eukprot:6239506-Pyramimonas_sp.AAC.1